MSAFADSSALVKLYVEEAGREEIEGLSALVVSDLARVEVPSALWRKHRLGELGAAPAATLVRLVDLDFAGEPGQPPRFAVVALPPRIIGSAAVLTGERGLRALDSVQLACALAARESDPGCDTFACFDERLRAAAAVSGFALVP